MKQNKTAYYIYFTLCGLIALYFVSTSSSSADRIRAEEDDQALAALFGGTSASVDFENEDAEERSLFESDFFKSDVPEESAEDNIEAFSDEDDLDPDILEPADSDNPTNPQTGQPYPNAVMKQFSKLREKFPDNDIIPHKKAPEEKQAEQQYKQEMIAMRSKISKKQASEGEVGEYYNYKMKPVRDRLELLDYVLEQQGDKMSEDIKSQYEKIKEMNNKQLLNYEMQKNRALTNGG